MDYKPGVPNFPMKEADERALAFFLQSSAIINFQEPAVRARARALRDPDGDDTRTAQACFEWVRDEIKHSGDYQMDPVTCTAFEVLEAGAGFCYAKAHLLAALLRANGIPAALAYQRLSQCGSGPPYCTHGLNALYLPEYGWYRVDARGNKPGVDAQFTPPEERLAFAGQDPGEYDFPRIYAEPPAAIVKALRHWRTWDTFSAHLPDVQEQDEAT